VWKVFEAYGFRQAADSKKKKGKGHTFDGPVPNPCFELTAREQFLRGEPRPGRLLPTGELKCYPVNVLAKQIRASSQVGYLHEDNKVKLEAMDDREMVRGALSAGGLNVGEGFFFSFCADLLEPTGNSWHCRICKECFGWRVWHCKGCNKCRYGCSIPCQKCTPRQYANRMKEYS